MADSKGIFSKTNIIIFGGIVGLPMLYIGYDTIRTLYFGAEQGAACVASTDCKGAGAWCMKAPDGASSFCTRKCVSEDACPAGWACGDSGYTQALTKTSGEVVGVKRPVNVCWAPGKGKPPPFRP